MLTDDSLVMCMPMGGALRLKLRLDDIERTCCYACSESTASAGCKKRQKG